DRDVTDELKRKKYNFVVGNPPYVRVQKINEIDKKKIKKNYTSVQGKFDLYIPFLELGIKLLQDDGKLGYINPNLFIQR
ncbi:MAG: Eco57I restriction-modification methylase domain-containing protein, partial [Nitrosotalea sp.]